MLTDIILAILGPKRTVLEVNLYGLEQGMFSSGVRNKWLNLSAQEQFWYEDVNRQGGGKVITRAFTDQDASTTYSANSDILYISLCRRYFDSYNTPQGYVEVRQKYDDVLEKCFEIENMPAYHLYLFNEKGEQFFPAETDRLASYYFNTTCQNETGKLYYHTNPDTGKKELIQSSVSSYTGFTACMLIDEDQLLQPVFQFVTTAIVMAFLFLGCAIFLALWSSKKISDPIHNLSGTMHQFSTIYAKAFSPIPLHGDYRITELQDLTDSFDSMQNRLYQSIQEAIQAETQANRSKLSALRSQMNPHFLYNSLTTISAMAEEEMNDDIISMCENISDMLRYISSDREDLVPLQREVEHTRNYLECMCARYRKKLSYEIDVSDKIRHVKVPKLIIQLLVENAIKYGTNVLPPWAIRISGGITGTNWFISVYDNGAAFDQEVLDELLRTIRTIQKTECFPDLEIHGMGLLNIYIRLYLQYKESAIFEIQNEKDGGVTIIVGGAMKREENDGR